MDSHSDLLAIAGGDERQLARLRWRGRRGMRELDQLLERYLALAWPAADTAERAAYERLLECEDTDLWSWLIGRARPEDAELDALVQRIQALPVR